VNGAIPKVKVHYVPRLCNHCDKAICMEACSSGAIVKREDGFVLINPDVCKGCGACAKACPYDAVFFNEELKISQKCTGCAHLLDNGYKLPRCAEICPTDAMRFGEEEEFADELRGATVLQPEKGLGPRVYYLNIPGQFIAGTIFDNTEREVIIGAKCRATVGGKVFRTETDEYGDFWFRDLPVGKFDVAIEPKGYAPKYFYSVDTAACINLGDIPMEKA
jgi:Fe-S-cluster-containing dehydrogenase component